MGREEASGWGTHVCLWWIHVDTWQNQYNIIKLKNKVNPDLQEVKPSIRARKIQEEKMRKQMQKEEYW